MLLLSQCHSPGSGRPTAQSTYCLELLPIVRDVMISIALLPYSALNPIPQESGPLAEAPCSRSSRSSSKDSSRTEQRHSTPGTKPHFQRHIISLAMLLSYHRPVLSRRPASGVQSDGRCPDFTAVSPPISHAIRPSEIELERGWSSSMSKRPEDSSILR